LRSVIDETVVGRLALAEKDEEFKKKYDVDLRTASEQVKRLAEVVAVCNEEIARCEEQRLQAKAEKKNGR